jgi:integrase/recombinase XerC
MLYEAGLRRSELTALDDKDVDFTTRQIRVTGKRRKQRVIPFGDEMEEALRTYMAVREEKFGNTGEALFLDNNGRRMTGGQVYTEVKKHLTGATSLSKRSPHVLRHSFATALLNHGAGLENVRQLLGHESVKTTEIYTHVDIQDLRKAILQCHPANKDNR